MNGNGQGDHVHAYPDRVKRTLWLIHNGMTAVVGGVLVSDVGVMFVLIGGRVRVAGLGVAGLGLVLSSSGLAAVWEGRRRARRMFAGGEPME